jgi:hypothetical protein
MREERICGGYEFGVRTRLGSKPVESCMNGGGPNRAPIIVEQVELGCRAEQAVERTLARCIGPYSYYLTVTVI